MKAENEILGPEATFQSDPVVGEFPTLRTILGPRVPRPAITEREKVAQRTRKLMAQELAAAKIKSINGAQNTICN